jgi:ABC-type multidrug transport system ATPase subunit
MATGKASDGGVVLSCLSKSYGGLRAVDSIDLSIPRGETVAILGPNGAGKTTTLDMVLGLTRPDSGALAPPPDNHLVDAVRRHRPPVIDPQPQLRLPG